jgi:hypothetical protein
MGGLRHGELPDRLWNEGGHFNLDFRRRIDEPGHIEQC